MNICTLTVVRKDSVLLIGLDTELLKHLHNQAAATWSALPYFPPCTVGLSMFKLSLNIDLNGYMVIIFRARSAGVE